LTVEILRFAQNDRTVALVPGGSHGQQRPHGWLSISLSG
jgi:hypothetical protein